MNASQILVYLLLGLIVLTFIRKSLKKRKVKHYLPDDVNNRVKQKKNILLLDVRTEHERKSGFIKNSFHIPLNQLSRRYEELKKFQDKEIICYCRSGNRSLSAAVLLKKQGFNAANLQGGITAWNYQNLK